MFPGSTDFTEAIYKMPQRSKHFSAMLIIIMSDKDQDQQQGSITRLPILS